MSDECDAEEGTPSSASPTPEVQVLPGSPFRTLSGDFRTVLDEFRVNWQRELHAEAPSVTGSAVTTKKEEQVPHSADDAPASDTLDSDATAAELAQAENLFRKAAELEQRGKVYDALPLYRKAIQIVPDIEFKYYEQQSLKANNVVETQNTQSSRVATPDDGSDNEELIEDLYEKFRLDVARDYGGRLLLSSRDAGVISTELHMSNLPPELLLYILRWVVSTQLDMRSLEQCAAVCKGLYMCARDDDLWRLACIKVWGYNVGTLLPPNTPTADAVALGCLPYYSWRQMFVERDRVLFNGCYISKTTYLRMGENSFQDQFYRPVQLVEYYRYVRFLPDGSVLMMSNADEPQQGVAKLRNMQQLRPDVLRGHYSLFGNTVSVILKKPSQQAQRIVATGARQRRVGGAAYGEELNSTNYCIEFRIMSTPKRKFTQLSWIHYSIEQTRNKVQTTSEFELTPSRYPPLWFSPVRSFHLDAEAPLA